MANSTPTSLSGLFKKVYVDKIKDLLPKGFPMSEMIKFEERFKNGSSIQVPVNLTHENGITLGGQGSSEVTFESAKTGIIKQAEVVPYELFLSSGILTAVLSRATSQGPQSFEAASKNRVKANIKSHQRLREHFMVYGQDENGIGRDADGFSGSWGGATITDGDGSITADGVTYTFVSGVDVSNKAILLNPADLASGILLGSEGLEVQQLNASTDAVLTADMAIVSVNTTLGIVTFDKAPDATDVESKLVITGQEESLEMAGAKKILTNTGSLFGINASTYSLWKGTVYDVDSGKLTFEKIIDAVSKACDRGLDSDVVCLVSHASWADLISEQAALRNYDSSFSPDESANGSKGLKFHFVNGSITIKASRFIRRADAFILNENDWHLYGSSDISMKVPGLEDNELLQKPINSNVFVFRSYSDSVLFCDRPSASVYLKNIDPDAAS